MDRCVSKQGGAPRGLSPVARWFVLATSLLVALSGCDEGAASTPPPAPSGRWDCPATWVAAARGGCGPAVLLCAPDGGAAPRACEDVDLSRAPSVPAADGGVTRGFFRLPDGAIAGGWAEPGDPEGPPPEDWSPEGVPADDWAPDAGIAACAAGWRRLPDGTCDPVLREDCEAGSDPVPGGSCTPTGATSCPAGDYVDPGAEAVGAAVVYVRAGADPDAADGSEARPFATIAAGIARAGSGGWVLVARGEYAERIVVAASGSTHVLGACAARVTVRGPGPLGRDGATVAVSGAGARLDLRGVTVVGEGRGLQASAQGALRASGVAVAASAEVAVDARDARTEVALTGCAIRDTRARADGTFGRGVSAQSGASVRVAASSLARSTEIAVHALDEGTSVALRGSVVRDTRATRGGAAGYGLRAEAAATLTAEGCVVEASQDVGALAVGARLELRASIVRGTRPRGDGTKGFGVGASAGATVLGDDLLVEGNAAAGVAADGAGASVTIARSVVRGTAAQRSGAGGYGLSAANGARLAAEGVRVAANREAGVTAYDPGTVVTLLSCVVSDTLARASDATRGYGVDVEAGAALTAQDVLVAGNTGAGVFATGAGARCELARSAVRDTRVGGDGQGHGLEAVDGATVRAATTAVTGSREAGAVASGAGARVELTACVVRGTRPTPTGARGRGLNVQRGAAAVATGVLFEDNTETGVVSVNEGSSVELTSSVVRATRPRADGVGGDAVIVSMGARLVASRVRVAYDAEVGLLAAGAGTRAELTACAARNTRGAQAGRDGVGLGVVDGASVTASGLQLMGCVGAGVLVQGAGSRLALSASAVRGVRPFADGILGRGLDVSSGGSLDARQVLLEGVTEFGVSAFGEGSAAALEDVLVARVARSARGFGAGVALAGGAQVTAARVAVVDVWGAGVLASPFMNRPGTRFTARDLFVRRVGASTVQAREAGPSVGPLGGAVAYGLHAGSGCALDLTRALVDDGGFGFYNAGGTIRVAVGVISAQLVAAGATDLATPAGATTLSEVALRGNARDAVVRDGALPAASSVEPPAAPPYLEPDS